jgi:hypothetical protein
MDNEVILIRGIEPVQIPEIVRHTPGFDEKKCEKELTARAERYPSKKEVLCETNV